MPSSASANLSLRGYSLTIPYFKDLFDTFGIEYHVINNGDFKGTGENYINAHMSKELRTQYSLVFDAIHSFKIKQIAHFRQINEDKLSSFFNLPHAAYLTPQEALKLGLITKLANQEEMLNFYGFAKKQIFSIVDYCALEKQNRITNKKEQIAVYYIDGVINNYYTGEHFSRANFRRQNNYC